jgi:hypothetical protein
LRLKGGSRNETHPTSPPTSGRKNNPDYAEPRPAFIGAGGQRANELYVANADGTDPDRLTDTEALNEASPSWLTDGLRIAYQRGEQVDNAEAMSILEINPDGSCGREILDGSGPNSYASPAWRPSEPREGSGPLRC